MRALSVVVLGCLVGGVLGGCGVPSFLITPVPGTRAVREQTVAEGNGNKVAIIEVEGLLLNARTGGFLQPSENDVSIFVEQLEKAEKDPAVKAVVLRVNSPGGTVSASDVMYQNLLRFKERTGKVVVASAQDVAASGGYYVALGADKIVVQPTSVVGSIGTIFQTMEFSGTLEKIGASSAAIKSGPLKDMGSPFKPLEDQERAVMQGMVDEYFARFREVVARHRHMKGARLAEVSDGRVFSGEQAVVLGLADAEGLLEDAIELAKEMGGVKGARVVMYRRPHGYTGSIYAKSEVEGPKGNVSVMQLGVPGVRAGLPTGFYYLWAPG